MSRLLPGPAPEGRWDELSSGECALLGARGAALTGPIVGVVLAMMSWTAACRGRPCALGRAARARFSIGNSGCGEPQVGRGGFTRVGSVTGASCPMATGCSAAPVNELSRGFGVRAWRWRAGGLPRGAGEGLARCEQSSTHGNLLLYKG